MESGKALTETLIVDSGSTIKRMDLECIFGLMEINTKVNGDSVFDMDKAKIFSLTVISTLVSIIMVKQRAMVSINGLMVIIILACSRMDKKKEEVFGVNQMRLTVILMKVNIIRI